MHEPDVVVVGGGPVGLTLGLGLARAGRKVLVLEKKAGTAQYSRAPAIWPRTQEVLAGLGVIEGFVDHGTTLEHLVLWDADRGKDLLSLPLEELSAETARPGLLIVPQSETEHLLAEALEADPNAELRFRAEVVAVENQGTGVKVSYRNLEPGSDRTQLITVTAAFAVGCDGAHSLVRGAIGAELTGVTYEMRVALADVTVDWADTIPFPRLSTRDGLVLGIRMSEGVWRLIMPYSSRETQTLESRVAHAIENLFPRQARGEGASTYRITWQSVFSLHRRMASRLVRGRIVLAGDAAHLTSPVGGQGMNAGMQDAAALTATLLEALETKSPTSLARYERERRRVIEKEIGPFTDRLTRSLLWAGGRFIKPVLRAAALALKVPPVRHRFLRSVAMLDRA